MSTAGVGTSGRRLGRYHLVEPLGGGPTGEVFRAKVYGVAGFEREFAVKRFHPEFVGNPETATSLAKAARTYGGLEHPRIARLHEYGVAGGETFAATEFVDGVDAGRLLSMAHTLDFELPIGAWVALISQSARAVGYAHGRGICHLGLCPTNILATRDGDIKITDFCFLPTRLPARPSEDPTLRARMPYLAPEQLVGELVNPATDVYQLGTVLYELLAERTAFSGGTSLEIAQDILQGQVAPLALPTPLEDGFGKVLGNCLRRSPFERYADARALADALDATVRELRLPGDHRDLGRAVRQLGQRVADMRDTQGSGAVSFPIPAPPIALVPTSPIPAAVSPPVPATEAAGSQAGANASDQAADATLMFAQVSRNQPRRQPQDQQHDQRHDQRHEATSDGAATGTRSREPGENGRDSDRGELRYLDDVPTTVKPRDMGFLNIPEKGAQPRSLTNEDIARATTTTRTTQRGIPPAVGNSPPVAMKRNAGQTPMPAPASLVTGMGRDPTALAVPQDQAINAARPPSAPPPAVAGQRSSTAGGAAMPGRAPSTPEAPAIDRAPSAPGYDSARDIYHARESQPLGQAADVREGSSPSMASMSGIASGAHGALRDSTPLPGSRPLVSSEPSLDGTLPITGAESIPGSAPGIVDMAPGDAMPASAPPPTGGYLSDATHVDGPPTGGNRIPSMPLPSPPLSASLATPDVPAELAAILDNEEDKGHAGAATQGRVGGKRGPLGLIAVILLIAGLCVAGFFLWGSGDSAQTEVEGVVDNAVKGADSNTRPMTDDGNGGGDGTTGDGGGTDNEGSAAMDGDGDGASGTTDGDVGGDSDRNGDGEIGVGGLEGDRGKDADEETDGADRDQSDDATRVSGNIASGDMTVRAGRPGRLRIKSRPRGAKVYLDGSLQGKTNASYDATSDRHRLALILPGHRMFSTEIQGRGDIEVRLKEVTPTAGPAGIKVRCRKKNRYYVFVDGHDTGQLCPTERIGVELGEHVVEIYDPVSESRQEFRVNVEDTRRSVRVRVD